MEALKKVLVVGLVLAFAIVGFEPMLANGFTGTFCGMTKDGLDACKPCVRKENPTPPSPACCSALKKADFECLCRNKEVAVFYGVDLEEAMKLPGKCHINKSDQCN
ncbi:hypothetical protein L6164_031943 [Bauhinia variegata]|uniref:Uncharacterized protein n=1 Tax=Bauhinia variegata TaxID=167791 RepID=A0ACB9KM12_BAUVA|nr:hypothetical protein L6164_031943 [Bauhinia variegata]